MSSRSRGQDPRPLLAIVAVILALALRRLVSHLEVDPHGLVTHLASLAPIPLGASAIATALATRRLIATRRTLASRLAVAIVPADGFDPRPDTVAAQLANGSRRIGAWADRPACALRIRLANDASGRLAYLFEVPERDLSRLRTALRGYRGVEIWDAEEVLATAARAEETGARRRTVRIEMVLSRPSVEPLARLPLDPDPLSPFAGVRRDRGEEADVCLDLLPATGPRAGRLRRRMRRRARRMRGERAGSLTEVLGRERGSRVRSDPVELYERRALGKGIEAKLGEGETLFEAQILLRATAPEEERAKGVSPAPRRSARPRRSGRC